MAGCAEVVPDDAKNTWYFSMNTLKAAAGSRFVNAVMDDGVGGERGWRNRSFNRELGGEEEAAYQYKKGWVRIRVGIRLELELGLGLGLGLGLVRASKG